MESRRFCVCVCVFFAWLMLGEGGTSFTLVCHEILEDLSKNHQCSGHFSLGHTV